MVVLVVKHPSVCEVEKPLSASFPVIPNDPLMSGRTSRVLFHQTTMVILVAFIFLVVLYIPVALIVEKRLIFHADGAATVMTML